MPIQKLFRRYGGGLLRRLTAASLSALTGIGGHFYNRRPERAQFFLALFLAWPSLYLLTTTWIFGPENRLPDLGLGIVLFIFGIGLLSIWIASVVVSFRDAGIVETLLHPKRRLGELFGGMVLSFLSLAVIVYTSGFFISTTSELVDPAWFKFTSPSGLAAENKAVKHQNNFEHVLNFGGLANPQEPLGAPPSGDAQLVGRFTYGELPAAGVRLRLALNGTYETEELSTNADGQFSVALPPGEWTINRVRTLHWNGKPSEGEFILTSERDARLAASGSYRREAHAADNPGWKVVVGETPTPIQLAIRPAMQLTWPPASATGTDTHTADGVIRWAHFPGASTYLVSLSEVEHQASGTEYQEIIARRVVGETELALSTLKSIPGDGPVREYAVAVRAFAADGSFLSETRAAGHARFALRDGRWLLEDEVLGLAASDADIAQVLENRKRLRAAELLIQENMFSEAERLLYRIRGKREPGRREALAGFLLARRGRCAEAKYMFNQAESLGGAQTVPDTYRTGCP